jgi:hypothetical protein
MLNIKVPALALLMAASCGAQEDNFVGGYLGISTLSADGRTDVTSTGARFSSYKPENGMTGVGFGGRHVNDWFSVMGSYGWNGNTALMTYGEAGPVTSVYSQEYKANMHTVMGEGLLYFRPRRSRIRPYLTAGAGVAHTEAAARGNAVIVGNPVPAPRTLSKTGPAFRVAVGIDLFVTKRLAVRYSFSETLQGNVFSEALMPPGSRKLANFQNWFGMAYYF